MTDLSNSVKGRIGELLAAAAIEHCGWKTLLTPMDHIDLVAMRGTRFMRVQVKAGNLLKRPDRRASYSFYTRDRAGQTLNNDLIDIVALVALDQRKVVFDLPSNLKTHTVLRPEDFHDIDIERITWENAVTQILGEAYGVRSRPEVS